MIDEFADSYLGGATPVPCIRCNERVKFKDLMETAIELDADHGHWPLHPTKKWKEWTRASLRR